MIPSPVLPQLTKNIFHYPSLPTPRFSVPDPGHSKGAPVLKVTWLFLVFPIKWVPTRYMLMRFTQNVFWSKFFSFQLLRCKPLEYWPMYFCSPGGILQPNLGGTVMELPVCPSFEDSCFLSLCGSSLRWGWGAEGGRWRCWNPGLVGSCWGILAISVGYLVKHLSVCINYRSSLSIQGPSPLSDAVYWVWFLPVCSFAFIILDKQWF